MKTKIFLPVLAMFCLMLTSFAANANSIEESTFCNNEIETFESTIINNPVEDITNLESLEDELRIRIRIRFRRVEIIIDIEFSRVSNPGATGELENNQLEATLDGDNLVVNGFEGLDGSIMEVSESFPFETEEGVYEILPGSYEINGGKAAFSVSRERQ